jgi:alginate O-acetyltransferase complex protein AlgI
MLFSTGVFIYLFLPVSLIGYQLLSRFGRNSLLGWLAFVSLFFYGYWNPPYLLLLCASILLNFVLAKFIGGLGRPESIRDRWLTIAIVLNLLLLMWFKYLFPLLGFLNAHTLIHHGFGNVLLPLGISFFTFTQIAYLIDLRQGITNPQGLLSYTVFVTFFPHLIAGPIIHPREIMPQLGASKIGPLRKDDMALGLSWFILGLGKKVLLADAFAPKADAFYRNTANYGLAATWLGTICYAMQLYFDFSGYSDMALGLARMFSIRFPINFDSPYKAQSIIEFWQRWHMTLSRYIGEYLYTPILRHVNGHRMDAGKKVSRKAQATLEGFVQMIFFPTMTSMFIAGIWHGAGLQYLMFGSLHGVYLVINHAWRIFTPKGQPLHGKLPPAVSTVLTFVCVLVSLVFFRAENVTQAFHVLGQMVGSHKNALPLFAKASGKDVLLVVLAFFIVWAMPNTQEILNQLNNETTRFPRLLPQLRWRPSVTWSLLLTLLFCGSILMLDASTSFLYFQF